MTILIKDPETDRIVRELAARTGETIKDAVKTAAAERLARVPAPRQGQIDREALERTLARIRSYPVTDDRPADEIIGYDENGLPS
jgi:antitoxin VapB